MVVPDPACFHVGTETGDRTLKSAVASRNVGLPAGATKPRRWQGIVDGFTYNHPSVWRDKHVFDARCLDVEADARTIICACGHWPVTHRKLSRSIY